ncbi:MAG: hypothetical protein GTO18_17600 [Anaerolineales bacterium]|nr:hypothetical protein [Anaerolineales bacterium]
MDPDESREISSEDEEPVDKNPLINLRKLLKREPSEERDKGSGWLGSAALVASLVLNLIFLIILIVVAGRLFSIKSEVAEPLLEVVDLTVQAIEDTTIQADMTVKADVPVSFDVPLQRETTVILSQPTRVEGVELSIRSATFSIDAPASFILPAGTQLPITMDLTVPVQTTVPVEVVLPVELSLEESGLEQPIGALQDLIVPYRVLLGDAPDCWQMLLWGGECP